MAQASIPQVLYEDRPSHLLIDKLEKARAAISNTSSYTVTTKKRCLIENYFELINLNSQDIIRNYRKKRAHQWLCTIFRRCEQLIFLLALSVSIRQIALLRSEGDIEELVGWWSRAEQPLALIKIATSYTSNTYSCVVNKLRPQAPQRTASRGKYKDAFAKTRPADGIITKQVRVKLRAADFFKFLESRYRDYGEIELICPYQGNPLPSIEMSHAKMELSRELCAAVVEHVRIKFV